MQGYSLGLIGGQGLVPVIRTYHVPGDRSLPGNGTVIAIRGAGQNTAQIYVEDRPV